MISPTQVSEGKLTARIAGVSTECAVRDADDKTNEQQHTASITGVSAKLAVQDAGENRTHEQQHTAVSPASRPNVRCETPVLMSNDTREVSPAPRPNVRCETPVILDDSEQMGKKERGCS